MIDQLGRPLRDLRVSVTDRCNFRCTYCMPREVYGRDFHFLPRPDLLSFEEISRLVRVFAAHGVRKVRLTVHRVRGHGIRRGHAADPRARELLRDRHERFS